MLRIVLTGQAEDERLTAALRDVGCQVQFLSLDQLLNHVRSAEGRMTMADCIICPTVETSAGVSYNLERGAQTSLEACVGLAADIEGLGPEFSLPDGRRWSAIPVVVLMQSGSWRLHGLGKDSNLFFTNYTTDSQSVLEPLKLIVSDYRDNVLADMSNFGLMISDVAGELKVSHVLTPKESSDGRYYFAAADERAFEAGQFFTVDRQDHAEEHLLVEFEALVGNSEVTEGQLQNFFEAHPHFLPMQSLSTAIPHVRLTDARGEAMIPDFILKPLVAEHRDNNWEVLDIKRPQAQIVTNLTFHPKLSADVHRAISQLRDYGDYFSDEAHSDWIDEILGRPVRYPRLGVLIGRTPEDEGLVALNREQHRAKDVRIVSYDDVLDMRRGFLGG